MGGPGWESQLAFLVVPDIQDCSMSCLELQLIQLRQGQGSASMDMDLTPALFPEQPVGCEWAHLGPLQLCM